MPSATPALRKAGEVRLGREWFDDPAVAGRRVWPRRLRLTFPASLQPGQRYSLPIFLRNEDAQDAFLADEDGRPCICCEDSSYEALDHKLFWMGCLGPESGSLVIYLYKGMAEGCTPMLSPAHLVFPLAEAFQGSRSSLLERWSSATESGSATRGISTEPFLPVEEGGIGLPSCGDVGALSNALWLDTSAGFILLTSTSEGVQNLTSAERLHLRVHFFDDGEPAADHWLGCASPLGAGAVGVTRQRAEVYGILHGHSPGSMAECRSEAWKSSGVQRSVGWHFLELLWEDGTLSASIDREPISEAPAECPSEQQLKVTIGAAGGNCGVWAALEVMRTPRGRDKWDMDLQSVGVGECRPWRARQSAESGSWQFDGTYVLEHIRITLGAWVRVVREKQLLLDSFIPYDGRYSSHPAMYSMLGHPFQVVEQLEDGMIGLRCPEDGVVRYFPPAMLSISEAPADDPSLPADASEPSPQTVSPEPPLQEAGTPPEVNTPQEGSTPQEASAPQDAPARSGEPVLPEAAEEGPTSPSQGFVLECWTRPDESDVERIERAMGQYLEYFRAAGIVVPENIGRVGKCQADHNRCFVFRFGTRKVHLSAREGEDGRLTLVVRIGGGFSDLVDFARRHGNLEQRKFVKIAGSEQARVTTVVARRRTAGRASASSPGPRPSSSASGARGQA